MKKAIVLAGGASHGAYHIGVLRALFEGKGPAKQAVVPDVLAGISAGAFNASVLLSELEEGTPSPVDALEKVWLRRIASTRKRPDNGVLRIRGDLLSELGPKHILNHGLLSSFSQVANDAMFLTGEAISRCVGMLDSNEPLQHRAVELVDLATFVSMKPFQKTIRKSVQLDAIRDSERAFRIGSVNWKTGKMRYFTKEDMSDEWGHEMIRASAAVPGIFPHVKVHGDVYCDGAAVENTPLSGAIQAGADELHVITSVPPPDSIPIQSPANTLDTLYRFLVIRESATLQQDLNAARAINEEIKSDGGTHAKYRPVTIHVYQPPESLGGLLSLLNFKKKFLAEMIANGYDTTLKHDCQKNGCVIAG